MAPVCSARCKCNYLGQGPKTTPPQPRCKSNYNDNPSKGDFCSLCGTKAFCGPGAPDSKNCEDGTVVVDLCSPRKRSEQKTDRTYGAAPVNQVL